ncbi:hypothetical protein Tsubulata_003073 [Turnera subulata]|uniref:Uncharacterized protein n=1 Tax=Turnera subulata TaxID=218843 RepID=A0A9Q0FQZ4_9ROSI|nr:hypothetical protein Tsubulata_003073 [Turnera subulata]
MAGEHGMPLYLLQNVPQLAFLRAMLMYGTRKVKRGTGKNSRSWTSGRRSGRKDLEESKEFFKKYGLLEKFEEALARK